MPFCLDARRCVAESLESRSYFAAGLGNEWLVANIGAATGSSSAAGASAVRLSAGGTTRAVTPGNPIGGSADAFHYLYRSFKGDAELVARVNPVTQAGVESGLVVRQALGASGAFVAVTRSASGLRFESRLSAGSNASSTSPVAAQGALFLKLKRDGNSYAGYFSSTGAADSWKLLGTAGGDLGATQLFGVATGSGSQLRATTSTSFTNIRAVTIRQVGGNLSWPMDRGNDLPYVDLVKTTRGFYNVAGRKAPNGHAAFANTDANGWPTEDFTFAAVDFSEWKVPADTGIYKMSFNGPAGVQVTGASLGVTVKKLSFANGLHTYDVTVGGGTQRVALTFRNTAGQVKNVRLLQPGYALANTPTFTTKFANLIKAADPTVLRFMDWAKINDDLEVNWSDRPKPTDASQAKARNPGDLLPGKGASWEHAVDLANLVGRNMWINIPARASDDYVSQLATLIRNKLRADLNVYVEYSNETWNWGFEQGTYNRAQAVQEVIKTPSSNLNYDKKPVDKNKNNAQNPQADTWGDRRHARRTKQIADLFRNAFVAGGKPNPINTRVRVVLAGQAAMPTRFDNMLAYLNKNYGAPKNYLWGVGIAPYFSGGPNMNVPGQTAEQIYQGMNSNANGIIAGKKIGESIAKAKSYGIRTLAYEGGADTYGHQNVAAKRTAHNDPRLQGTIVRFVQSFFNKGGDLFNYYKLSAQSYTTPYGAYSITEDLDQLSTNKIKALRQLRGT